MTRDIQKLRELAASLLDLSEQPQDVAGAQDDIRAVAVALPAILDRLEGLQAALREIADGDDYSPGETRMIEIARKALGDKP